jgi:SAM-dependent methyltransferase
VTAQVVGPTAKQIADLYGDLHTYADESFARDYFLPGFRRHLAALGLDPNTALRGCLFLDAGCGGYAGGLAIAMASSVRRATAVDLSFENATSARHRYPDARVAVQQGDLLSLPYATGVFDFVYCNGVLHHTVDPEAAFRELVRVLAPAGRIYIGVYGRGGLFNELFVPTAILMGRIISRQRMARVLKHIPILLRPSSSLMDLMYAPIQHRYWPEEIEPWFRRAGLTPTFLRHYYQAASFRSRLVFGEGTMMFFTAVKNAASFHEGSSCR